MARGKLTDKQIDTLLQAVDMGKSRKEACILVGLDPTNATRVFSNPRVIQRRQELDAEIKDKERERIANIGVEEPLTLPEFQFEIKKRMLDPNNKDAARYFEMYGKTIRAFTDRLEVEQTVSYADVLAKRARKNMTR